MQILQLLHCTELEYLTGFVRESTRGEEDTEMEATNHMKMDGKGFPDPLPKMCG